MASIDGVDILTKLTVLLSAWLYTPPPSEHSTPYNEEPDPLDRLSGTPNFARLDLQLYEDQRDIVDDIIQSLRKSGGCVIRNVLSKEQLDSMEKDVRPHLNAKRKTDTKREEFLPTQTRMVTGMLSKSKNYALNVVGNPIWQAVNEHFLTSTLQNYWHGNKSRISVNKPQLSTTATFSVHPGTNAQGLHRDDDIYHTSHPACREHHLGRDMMVCFFVAGKKCTRQNGATRVVPGSHLWDYSIAPPSSPDDDRIAYAELDPGDGFMMLGGCYHGAGANVTTDEERFLYAAFATRGYLRQEENQYLANDAEKMKELPLRIQKFAGYSVGQPYMGWAGNEMDDPIRILHPEMDGEADFW